MIFHFVSITKVSSFLFSKQCRDECVYFPSVELDVPHLAWLQTAMQAVVKSGTAQGHFGKLTPYVYGKTGTAQEAKPKGEALQDTAWFVGFYE